MLHKNTQIIIVRMFYSALTVMFAVRLFEFFVLVQNPFISTSVAGALLLGFIDDITPLAAVIVFSGISLLLVPNSLAKAAQYIMGATVSVYFILTIALQSYFTQLLYPVDRLLFNMPFKDTVETAISSTGNLYLAAAPFIIALALFAIIYCASERIQLSRMHIFAGIGLILLSQTLRITETSNRYFSSDVYAYASKNKVLMLAQYNNRPDEDAQLQMKLSEAFAHYRSLHPEAELVDEKYPFLRKENYRHDVLSPHFSPFDEKPNIVILIVEALSRAYCGPEASIASCTPFIDSLIKHSLYWENCLATSERTFESFPSILGSLPYGRQGFTVDGDMPNHLTMLNILKHNGYRTSIFYANEFKLYADNWWSFFMRNNVDTILDKSCFPELPDFACEWGMSDETLFKHATSVMSANRDKPRLDVFLSYSTHEPYLIPDAESHQQRFVQWMHSRTDIGQEKKDLIASNIARFTTVYYLDIQLRAFVESLQQQPGYENTLFVITGDHSLSNLDPHNAIQQYHVPLIIYSPKITVPQHYSAVCSHQDIVPSVLCLLKNSSSIDAPAYTHWLGRMLDTSSMEKADYQIPLISASKTCYEYLSGNYFIKGKKIYECNNLQTSITDNSVKYEELAKSLTAFKVLNHYSYSQNKLLPDSIYKRYRIPSVILLDTIFETFAGIDSVSEFVPLANFTSAGNYRNIEVSMKSEMLCNTTDQWNMPRLVISSADNATNEALSYQIDFFKRTDWLPLEEKKWQNVSISQNTNLLEPKGRPFVTKAYLWNPERTPVYYRNIRLVVKAEL